MVTQVYATWTCGLREKEWTVFDADGKPVTAHPLQIVAVAAALMIAKCLSLGAVRIVAETAAPEPAVNHE